ncbi:leucine-rich repeat domain-containing protein, partial [Tannerella forsythia]
MPAGTEATYRAAPVWKNFKIDAGSMLYYDFTYNKLHYKITGSGSRFYHYYVKVVPEKAGMFNYSEGKRPTGNVTIPERFSRKVGIATHTYTVTEIGDYAFYNCKGLTSVSIPNTVQVIGNEAFRECSWMTSVRISGNALRKIGDAAFAGC